MKLVTIISAALILLTQVTAALSQQTTYEGMANIEDATAACGGAFRIGKPGAAAFKPANVGSNSAMTFFSFGTSGDTDKPSIAAISLRVAGTPASNSTYDAVEIMGDGANSTFSGIIHAAQTKPATITPTTSLVEVFMVLKNVRGIAGCNLRVRAGLVNW